MFCQRCNETDDLEKSESAQIYTFTNFNGSGKERQATIFPFKCRECGEADQSFVVYPNARKFCDQGVRITILVRSAEDLDLQIFKSSFATITLPEIEFEIPPTPQLVAATTTATSNENDEQQQQQHPAVFGSSITDLLQRSRDRIAAQQPIRRIMDPELANKLDAFICNLEECISLAKSPYTFIIDDPSGHSTVCVGVAKIAAAVNAATAAVTVATTNIQDRRVHASLYTRTREQNLAMIEMATQYQQQQQQQQQEAAAVATTTTTTAAAAAATSSSSSSDTLPEKNEDYASKDYWNKRYTTEESYDWFNKSYLDLQNVLDPLIDKSTSRILHIGCGNSKLGVDMVEQGGYKSANLVNMDYSEIVIDNMKAKYPNYLWEVMNVLDMSAVEAGSFDVVLDKGTMDALFVDEKSDEFDEGIHSMCNEIIRILKPGGKYIQVSFGQPHLRKRFILRPEYGWELEVKTVGEFFHYFVYILTKK